MAGYSKNDALRFLAAMTYEMDNMIIKKGHDPCKLRNLLYKMSQNDSSTKEYSFEKVIDRDGGVIETWYLNYVDGELESNNFPEYDELTVSYDFGTTLMYTTDGGGVKVINYDPNVVIGTDTDTDDEIKGRFRWDKYSVEDTGDYGCYIGTPVLTWQYHSSGVCDLVDILNNYPKIFLDLCLNDNIGILQMNKYIRYKS